MHVNLTQIWKRVDKIDFTDVFKGGRFLCCYLLTTPKAWHDVFCEMADDAGSDKLQATSFSDFHAVAVADHSLRDDNEVVQIGAGRE